VKASEFFSLPLSLQLFQASFPVDAAPWDWIKAIGPALKAASLSATSPKVPAGVSLEGAVFI
jgi:UDP-N-acetylglucosamine diphosphorylase / glucose-1-phosphate thymidylyltransferase / UDP-N-acetylgalactosamine diphosphorylase / glucosamine-1-phosphate N-acetyltransferase / galactosamine-1-phosphate N-acetyltransferase